MNQPQSDCDQSPARWSAVKGALLSGPSVPPEVLRQQIGIMERYLPLSLLLNVIVANALGWSIMAPGARGLGALWVLCTILLSGCRFADILSRRNARLDPGQMKRACARLLTGCTLQGVIWGIAGIFMFPASPIHQMLLVSVLTGMTAGAINSLSPVWTAYPLFAIPTMLPLCCHLLASPTHTQQWTGALALVFTSFMLVMASQFGRWLKDSLLAARTNESLTLHLQCANAALIEYHARLEATVQERTQELSETNARLEREIATNAQEKTRSEEREEALRRAQKLESLGVLAGGIAHDFNNLLGAILGNLELLQLQIPAESNGRVFLANMEKAVNRAKDLSRQMLAYSGKGHFAIQNLDLNQVVLDLTSLLQVCLSKRAGLRLELGQGPCSIFGDQAQLQQVVMNLVTNASEALESQDGEIHIATRILELDPAAAARISRVVPTLPGPHVLLEVRDTGKGMDPEVLARIFDPFFTTKENGRGLGLSAMLGILRGHRAGIEIASRPGAGSTFRIFFPASTVAPELAEPVPPKERPCEFCGRVLLVDDEPAFLESARAVLESLGLQVSTAGNGVEALELMAREGDDIALVLLDLTMPLMDGRQTLRALHALRPALPVILSSGYDSRQPVAGVREMDAQAFLMKPYTRQELQRALAAALGPDAALVRSLKSITSPSC